ncbi:MAG: C25 family cysteine peptidase [Bradymonadia bacterium]
MRTTTRNCSLAIFWVAAASLLSGPSYGQPVDNDGFVIISSRDTLLGRHDCRVGCVDDSGCASNQSCVMIPNVGQICHAIRDGQDPPDDWRLCEAALDCGADAVCVRQRAPVNVDAFIEHKRRRGFSVHLIDETTWGGGEGDQAADNIRAWLQQNYEALNLRYVLLIGDPRPTGDVPMRGTRPANNAHQEWADNPAVLTDYYFADLDGNWDLDGDGLLAEFTVNEPRIEPGSPASMHSDSLGDDVGAGGANRVAEVAVGRIPFYGDVDALDSILQKTMDYENASPDSIGWRRSALLAAEGEHRAFFGELIRSELLLPNGYSAYRVYDVHACWDYDLNEDVECRSPIDDVPDELHCTPAAVQSGIATQTPGFVTWLTHGSGRGAAAVMNLNNVMALADDQPFFTFQASCFNAQPTTTQNLAYELLKNGAIGTIGATTISHGPGSPMPSLRNDAGNAGMAYNFASRLLVEEMTAGEALADLRRDVDVANRWWYWKNYLTFNLWGDPSVSITSTSADQIEEPADGGMPEPSADMGGFDDGLGDAGMVADAGELSDSTASVDASGTDQMSDAAIDAASASDSRPVSEDAGIQDTADGQAPRSDAGDSNGSSSAGGGCMAAGDSSSQAPWFWLGILLFCGPMGVRRRTGQSKPRRFGAA